VVDVAFHKECKRYPLGTRGTTHIPQLVQCKSINCKSKKLKFHHQNSKSHNLFNGSPTTMIAKPTTANLYMLHNYHSSSKNQRFGR
jgi:hypothetical protein